MKVIIADDEIHICSLLKHLIQWEELGLSLLGVFNEGRSVLAQFEKEPADILICDIEMPGMNGIDLIEQVRNAAPDCQFVIVSGFRNFEYARNAMHLGVTHYLLKPIDKTELNKTLHAVISKSQQSGDIQTLLSNTAARQDLFNLLNACLSPGDMASVNKSYGFHFTAGAFNCIKAVFSGVDAEADVLPQLARLFRKSLRARLESFCSEVEFFKASPVSECILINYPRQEGILMNSLLDNIFHEILVELGGRSQSRCYLGIGKRVENTAELNKSFETAVSALNWRFVQPEKRVFYADFQNAPKAAGTKNLLTLEERHSLRQIIESIQPNQASRWVDDLFKKNEKIFTENPNLIRDWYDTTIDLLITAFDELNVPIGDKNGFRQTAAIAFDNSLTLQSLKRSTGGIIAREITRRLIEKQLNASAYVQQIKNYIQKNYAQKITLEIIAEVLHLTPVYLSIIFKNETGMNYSRYLTLVRMDKAKELLKRCDRNLTQISNEVGYDSTNYFTRLFKEVTGIKPSEYRRLHQRDIGN